MRIGINKKRLAFYVWVGLAYSLLWLISNIVHFPASFVSAVLNNIWRAAYIIVINLIFFEYTWPFVWRKRKYLLYNILLFLIALWVQLMLCSFGLYAWRLFGIHAHLYTALITFSSTSEALSSQASYGVMSLFFFGIIRHITNYITLKQATQQLRIEKQQAR